MADLSAELYGSPQAESNHGMGAVMDGLSPKDQADLRMKQYAGAQQRINDLRGEVASAAPNMSDLREFQRLNRLTSTGSGMENMLPDWKMLHGNNVNDMRKISQRMAPASRPAGAGSSSDTDVRMYLNALPSADDKGGVNDNIINDFSRRYNYGTEKMKFLQGQLDANGHLNGADSAWMKTPQYKNFMAGKDPSSVITGGGWSATKVSK